MGGNVTMRNALPVLLILAFARPACPQTPGLSAQWGGPVINANSFGDTWWLMDTSNGLRTTCNDCTGISGSNNSNVAFLSESSDLNTIALINGMTGLGTSSQLHLGMCAANEYIKAAPPISYKGKYVWPMFCQLSTAPNTRQNNTLQFSTSGNDGANWARLQDTFLTTSVGSTCLAGVLTLATASGTFASGSKYIVNNTGLVADGMYTAAVGSGASLLVVNSVTCVGSYSNGYVQGPATTTSSPWTSALFATGSMVYMAYAQICVDNTGCSATPDSTDTYLVGIGLDGNEANPISFRILKSDFDLNPNDASKYEFWVSGSTYTSTIGSAGTPQCVVNGVTANCNTNNFRLPAVTYVADAALPGGGQYFVTTYCFETCLWQADSITGPFTLVSRRPTDNATSPPIQQAFASTAASLYVPISSSPYKARIKVQSGGTFTSTYKVAYFDVSLSQLTPNNSPLFNRAPVPGVAGGGQWRHSTNGLVAAWQMQQFGDGTTLLDTAGNYPIAMSGNTAAPTKSILDGFGFENTNPSFNATWGSNGGAMRVPTGFNLDMGAFSVLLVAKSDLVGATQIALQGPTTAGNGFQFLYSTISSTMRFNVRAGVTAGEVAVCPSVAANTWFAMIAMRDATGKLYCFLKGTTAPAAGSATDTNSLGTYNLNIGSADGTSTNYWRGPIGEVVIWNRALCSTQIPGTCAAGQVDEIQKEFGIVHIQSRTFGWGL